MQKIEYTFEINADEKIVLIVDEYCKEDIHYDSWTMIFFIENKIKRVLSHDILNERCFCLSTYLKKVLRNELILDETQIPDIGWLSNEMRYKEIILEEENYEDISKYNLWQPRLTKDNVQTWLYNNKQGEIILFLSPFYPFFYSRRPKKYPSYKEWIKTYKAVARRIISQDTARQWLKQTHEIMNLIKTNSAPYLDELAKKRMENIQ